MHAGCRYHGWTYNATGALIKAPQFENVEGFDTNRNGLFEISLRVTDSGLVFINFDASIGGPAVRFQDWYNGGVNADVEMLGLAKKGEYVWSQSWVMDGNFNWKAAICEWSYFILFFTTLPDLLFRDTGGIFGCAF